ncbi:MAG: hypothetical protein IKE18_09085 [Oscillospiraceae bacterium]|nr:hypothetical protein [Oscillospiraceae bacterium]
MEYVAFIFAIFGFFAYIELSKLKNRVNDLEAQLSKVKGTSHFESAQTIKKLVEQNLGRRVYLNLREGYEDQEIYMAVYQKREIVMVDADGGWILVNVGSPKGTLEKLIRVESIQSIDVVSDEK